MATFVGRKVKTKKILLDSFLVIDLDNKTNKQKMEKQTQLLLGAAVLGLGGYLYWKSKQPKKMVGANGRIFSPEKGKVFKGANGIFKPTSSEKVFKGADATTKPVPKNFFKTASSSWVRGFTGGKVNVQSSNW